MLWLAPLASLLALGATVAPLTSTTNNNNIPSTLTKRTLGYTVTAHNDYTCDGVPVWSHHFASASGCVDLVGQGVNNVYSIEVTTASDFTGELEVFAHIVAPCISHISHAFIDRANTTVCVAAIRHEGDPIGAFDADTPEASSSEEDDDDDDTTSAGPAATTKVKSAPSATATDGTKGFGLGLFHKDSLAPAGPHLTFGGLAAGCAVAILVAAGQHVW